MTLIVMVYAPCGTQKVKSIRIPSVAGTYDVFRVYGFFCEVGVTYSDEWNCHGEVYEVVGINKDFCGDLTGYSSPTQPKDHPTWDDYCFFKSKPSYCDDKAHNCVRLCRGDSACYGADQYCLARYADNAKEITDLLDDWEKQESFGNPGCVDKDKVCKLSRDCRAMGGAISDNKYSAAHCEKTDIPSWLEDTNDLVGYGAFGMCKPGCKNQMDCTETIGSADDFSVPIWGGARSVRGESWTCLDDGRCRLNICNHDTDCWALEKTQMSMCESGVCKRVTCSNHYDCWDYVIIESGLDNYQYGCFNGMCQYAEWDSPGYLSSNLCEAAFGTPDEGKTWSVKGGKCKQVEIIKSECTVGAGKSKIQKQCTDLKGEPTEGYEWDCIRTQIEGKTYGVCNEVEIPVTENCLMANNPDEYCMNDKGVETLARGRKWICSENGICVLSIADCRTDADCKVGSIGGTCIDGLCQYGHVPPPPVPPVCGDGVCQAGEDKNNCAEDCGVPGGLKWDNLYFLPILLTLGLSLLFAWSGKRKTGYYSTFDFIVGGVLGAVIGIVLYFIVKYWVWITLVTLIGAGGAIAVILAIGGLPLLWFVFNYLTKGRAMRAKKRYYEKPKGEFMRFKERYY